MSEKPSKDVLRETDEEAIGLATRLLREARHASLASLEPEGGHPIASRVTMTNEMDGTPVILVSDLSSHTAALKTDPRCSLLIGELGKGDPLAYPRMSVTCNAQLIERDSDDYQNTRARFLNRHPKAALYIDFGDFHLFRLRIERISLNGGFGKAYALTTSDVILPDDDLLRDFKKAEASVIEHMNSDHQEAVQNYAVVLGKQKDDHWILAGVDPQGLDLATNNKTYRLNFTNPLTSADDIRPELVELAKKAIKINWENQRDKPFSSSSDK